MRTGTHIWNRTLKYDDDNVRGVANTVHESVLLASLINVFSKHTNEWWDWVRLQYINDPFIFSQVT